MDDMNEKDVANSLMILHGIGDDRFWEIAAEITEAMGQEISRATKSDAVSRVMVSHGLSNLGGKLTPAGELFIRLMSLRQGKLKEMVRSQGRQEGYNVGFLEGFAKAKGEVAASRLGSVLDGSHARLVPRSARD